MSQAQALGNVLKVNAPQSRNKMLLALSVSLMSFKTLHWDTIGGFE